MKARDAGGADTRGLSAAIAAAASQIATRVRRFLRDTRGGATSLVAVMGTLVILGGTAVVVDHLVLVDQRDTLRTAGDAAAIAATLRLNRLLDRQPDISDADLENALINVGRRHAILNFMHLETDKYDDVVASLVVEVDIDRAKRTVDVSVEAELRGTLVAEYLGYDVGNLLQGMKVTTGAKNVINPIEVVLAIDVSRSMYALINGTQACPGCPDNRISIVKGAARRLVDILTPDADDRIAIGVVPWHTFVRLDAGARSDWASNGWAAYPARRVYAEPYMCSGAGCTPPAAVEQTLAMSAPEPWKGCLDSHRIARGTGRAAVPGISDALRTPSSNAFAQAFFPARQGSVYECLSPPLPIDMSWQICFSGLRYTQGSTTGWPAQDAQFDCGDDNPSILPLSTDADTVRQRIDALVPVGGRTYSALGVLWAQRLLDHRWNGVWGGGVHPVDPGGANNAESRKALILLTDGEDTHCGIGNVNCDASALGLSRNDACAAVKGAGTEIFVIAAMHPSQVSGALGTALRACSSEADNPDGSYVFLNNTNATDLEAAFTDIATQLRSVRRAF